MYFSNFAAVRQVDMYIWIENLIQDTPDHRLNQLFWESIITK